MANYHKPVRTGTSKHQPLQVEVAENTLPVAQHQAHTPKDSLEAELQMEASLVSARALLVQGKDDLAVKLAKQVRHTLSRSATYLQRMQQVCSSGSAETI